MHSIEFWRLWVDEHETEVAELARSSDDYTILLNKLRDNIFQRPTGEVVEEAFKHWKVNLPKATVKEIGKRNPSAHKFTMFDEIRGDIQVAADRVNMIQMLLAGAIAKHIGYTGPVVGWERDRFGRLTVPPFWPSLENSAAKVRFAITG